MSAIPLLICAYLLGSLPIGLYVGKMVRGIDVREFGSGNTGASNVARVLISLNVRWGPAWGILVFLLDVAKGLLPTVMAQHRPNVSPWLPILTGIAAIMGHNFSPFLRFKGGKGVATSLGVALGLSWQAGLIGFAAWGVIVLLTRYISVASVIGTPVGAFCIWWFNDQKLPYGLFALLTTVFVIVKHKTNFARLKAGTESKIGRKTDTIIPPPSEVSPR